MLVGGSQQRTTPDERPLLLCIARLPSLLTPLRLSLFLMGRGTSARRSRRRSCHRPHIMVATLKSGPITAAVGAIRSVQPEPAELGDFPQHAESLPSGR